MDLVANAPDVVVLSVRPGGNNISPSGVAAELLTQWQRMNCCVPSAALSIVSTSILIHLLRMCFWAVFQRQN